jgi:hypothetical protein
MVQYLVERTRGPVTLPTAWDGEQWGNVGAVAVDRFHPASTSTHPVTAAKALYDDAALYLHFRVADRFVRAAYTTYQSRVCEDSCVEFFVRPRAGKGYFNFEINPIGTLLLFYVTDPARVGDGLKEYEPVPADTGGRVRVWSSMDRPVVDEIVEPVEWWVQYAIPFEVFEHYLGPVRPAAGERWRANFYKCADRTSRPHWASWSPIGDELNFHQPDKFGELVFG